MVSMKVIIKSSGDSMQVGMYVFIERDLNISITILGGL